MILKIKAFIYRFSAIFGLSIYLAQKEELEFLKTMVGHSDFDKSSSLGLWQGKHGFTTVWTYKKSFFKAFIAKTKHAFDFRSYK
jgi:hypothetical protein